MHKTVTRDRSPPRHWRCCILRSSFLDVVRGRLPSIGFKPEPALHAAEVAFDGRSPREGGTSRRAAEEAFHLWRGSVERSMRPSASRVGSKASLRMLWAVVRSRPVHRNVTHRVYRKANRPRHRSPFDVSKLSHPPAAGVRWRRLPVRAFSSPRPPRGRRWRSSRRISQPRRRRCGGPRSVARPAWIAPSRRGA